MTAGISGKGSQFHWNSQHVLELSKLSGPSEKADVIDVTSHDSASDYKEFVAGLRDGGEISIEGNFIIGDATGQIAMHTDFQAGTARTWSIDFPAVGDIAGSGIVTAWEISFPDDDKISLSATIKVTGKPTLTVT